MLRFEKPDNDGKYGWRRAFAWLSISVAMNSEPIPEKNVIHHAYCDGDAEFPRVRIWWEPYEWRYTGRGTSLFDEIEYRIGASVFVNWVRNGYDC